MATVIDLKNTFDSNVRYYCEGHGGRILAIHVLLFTYKVRISEMSEYVILTKKVNLKGHVLVILQFTGP